jgi:hypothetical protein
MHSTSYMHRIFVQLIISKIKKRLLTLSALDSFSENATFPRKAKHREML